MLQPETALYLLKPKYRLATEQQTALPTTNFNTNSGNRPFKQFLQGWCCSAQCLRNFVEQHRLTEFGTGFGLPIFPLCNSLDSIEQLYDPELYIWNQNASEFSLKTCLVCERYRGYMKFESTLEVKTKFISEYQQKLDTPDECCVIHLSLPKPRKLINVESYIIDVLTKI